MTAKEFAEKWGVTNIGVYYYKKAFPQFVIDGKFNYKKFDKEQLNRLELKTKLQKICLNVRPYLIADCFNGKDKQSIAYTWIQDLYMQDSRRKIIGDKAYDTMTRVANYLEYCNFMNFNSMSEDEFMEKWNYISKSSIYFYKKKYPQFTKNGFTNWNLISEQLEHRIGIFNEVGNYVKTHKVNDYLDMFDGVNALQKAYVFRSRFTNRVKKMQTINDPLYERLMDFYNKKIKDKN